MKDKSGGLKNFELHDDKGNGEQILFRYWAEGYGGSLLTAFDIEGGENYGAI